MSNQNNIRNGIYNTFNSTPDQQQFVRNYSSSEGRKILRCLSVLEEDELMSLPRMPPENKDRECR